MKRALLFPLLLLAATGCDNFYHARYRHPEKVPASGVIAHHETTVPLSSTTSPPPASADTSSGSATSQIPGKEIPAATQPLSAPEKKATAGQVISEKIFPKHVTQQKSNAAPHRGPGRGMALFLSLLLFLLGASLIYYGFWLLYVGIVFGTPVIIALGIICLLYGTPPVWAVVRALFTQRKRPDPSESQ